VPVAGRVAIGGCGRAATADRPVGLRRHPEPGRQPARTSETSSRASAWICSRCSRPRKLSA
jgi:hypothetical protein